MSTLLRKKKKSAKKTAHLCECGCGASTRSGWRYRKGHGSVPDALESTRTQRLSIRVSPAEKARVDRIIATYPEGPHEFLLQAVDVLDALRRFGMRSRGEALPPPPPPRT